MRSVPQALDRRTFDFLIVGGGIQGAAMAREAALRGCSVLLVERGDFASGTSSRSSRLVHGGVRYLQQGHVSLVREALAERERLLRTAPHLVRPLPMLMPFFGGAGKPAWMLRLGLRLYRLLAGRTSMPAPRSHGAADCARLFPGIRTQGLRGGMLYYDARTDDVRLTLAVLEAAVDAGASIANHCEVLDGDADGVHLLDRDTDSEVRVYARRVINAAGPQADAVRARFGVEAPPLVRTSRGSHLVLPPRASETALGAFLPDGRIQFVIPHQGGTLCGTTDVDEVAGAVPPTVPAADVAYLLETLRFLLAEPPGPADVRFAYCGWRSLPVAAGPPGRLNREAFVVAETCAAGALHTVVGGKLTTHRSFAERTVNRLLGRRDPSPSCSLPLPGGAGPHDDNDPLWQRHGSRAGRLRALAGEDANWLQPICPHRPFLAVEAVFALRHQAVVTFADLMLRRLFDVQGPCLRQECLQRVHALYERERPRADGVAADIAALHAEVTHMTGAAVTSGSSSLRAPNADARRS